MELKQWAELIYIPEKLELRTPGSKHQRKIAEILDLISLAKGKPSNEVYERLVNVHQVKCPTTESDPVNYCRYLQVCLDILKNEGSTESIKGE